MGQIEPGIICHYMLNSLRLNAETTTTIINKIKRKKLTTTYLHTAAKDHILSGNSLSDE